jgi:hypothetical protein
MIFARNIVQPDSQLWPVGAFLFIKGSDRKARDINCRNQFGQVRVGCKILHRALLWSTHRRQRSDRISTARRLGQSIAMKRRKKRPAEYQFCRTPSGGRFHSASGLVPPGSHMETVMIRRLTDWTESTQTTRRSIYFSCDLIHASTRRSSTSSGIGPPTRITSWKARQSNFFPSRSLARWRSSMILILPMV